MFATLLTVVCKVVCGAVTWVACSQIHVVGKEGPAGDGGWTLVSDALWGGSPYAIAVDPAHPSTVYLGSDHGLFVSSNAGASWNPASTGLPPQTPVHALALDSHAVGTIYALDWEDIPSLYKSTNGRRWGVKIALLATLAGSVPTNG